MLVDEVGVLVAAHLPVALEDRAVRRIGPALQMILMSGYFARGSPSENCG